MLLLLAWAVELRLVGLGDVLNAWDKQLTIAHVIEAYRLLSVLLLSVRLSPEKAVEGVSDEAALAFLAGIVSAALATIATVS